MANELGFDAASGQNLYVTLRSPAQTWLNGTALEAYNSGHWTSYAVTLTDLTGLGNYAANMAAAPAGTYWVQAYKRAGGSPATTDAKQGTPTPLLWDGAAEIDTALLLLEINGLLGKFQGVRNPVYTTGNLVSYDICIYDTSGHATTNDGATGLVHKYSVANTYDGSGNLLTSVTTRVS